MYHLELDQSRNLLKLKIAGYQEVDEVRECINDIIAHIRKLQPGFQIINDITEMKPSSQEGVEEMKKLQAYLSESRVGKIIRIVDSPMAKLQVHRVYNQVGSYEAVEVSSMNEAMAVVAETHLNLPRTG